MRVSGVRIVTDSTAYLPPRWAPDLGVDVVSLSVTEPDGTTAREVDLDWSRFYARMDASPVLPTSSQPPPGEFEEVFEAAAARGEDVVGVFISSRLSGTCSGARTAAEMVVARHPGMRIETVDSRTLAMALALIVRKAALEARRGATADEVAAVAREAARRARWLVLPTGLDNLRKGGRIGGAAALLGTALRITPIITIQDGAVELLAKVRTRHKALTEAIELFSEETGRLGLDEVAVQHIEEPEEARTVVDMLAECCSVRPEIYPVGPVVGVHVGPGVGIAYLTARPIRPAEE
jgi:DegV family protein with EDD domain